MTHFMAYVILLSAGIGACAILAELLLRAKTAPTRWAWIAALAAVMLITGAVTFMPLPVVGDLLVPPTSSLSVEAFSPSMVVDPARGATSVLQIADAVLPVIWPLASLFLLAAILYGQRRLHNERRDSESRTVNGREVLLTESSGPAVAGVGRPVVLLPRWVLALDVQSQELLLAHEFEHVSRGDTRLLLLGALGTAIMPWNPVAWWITRRLRLAVEQDCDARVLRAHPDVRRYADLLLMAAGHPSVSTRLLAAHFGEHRSDLDRRIQVMTDRTFRWRPTLAAAALAAALLVASCEAPRPEPLAPRTGEPKVVAGDAVLDESQVEIPVTQAIGSITPKYPDILRQAGVEGEVLVSFVVTEEGKANVESFKVIRSTHELFATAVKKVLPEMRFVPAEVGGKKVKQLVQQPFTFSIAGATKAPAGTPSAGSEEIAITGVPSQPRVILRGDNALREATPPYVFVYSYEGTVLARGYDVLEKINPQSIERIEVFKPNKCPADMTCPLIKITLARGKTLGPPAVVRPSRDEAAWAPGRPNLDSIMAAPHSVELFSSSGELITRHGSRGVFSRATNISSEDINASEARQTNCWPGATCTLTRIWLKPGREAVYRK